MGARVVAQYAVLGPYDFVTILEAPDNETVSSISIEMGARGTVQHDDHARDSARHLHQSPASSGASPADGHGGAARRESPRAPPREVHRLPPLRAGLLVHADRRRSSRRSRSSACRRFEGYTSYAPYTCTQCAEGWCMTACPGGRHPDQCRRRQGRDRRQVRRLQALHDRLPLRDHVLRSRYRTRPTSAISAAARPPAPRRARRRPSPTRRAETADWLGDFAAERTAYVLKMETPDVFAATRAGGRVMPARHLIIGGGTAGLNASGRFERKRGPGRLRDHAGRGRAAVLAHGAAVLPRADHRRVARLHGHAGARSRRGTSSPCSAGGPSGSTSASRTLHPRRRHHGRVRRLPDRHRLARGQAARSPAPTGPACTPSGRSTRRAR